MELRAIKIPTSTGSATSGAASVEGELVSITSEAITTAAGATYTLTITNSRVSASSTCLASVRFGTSTTGVPVITRITPASGSVVVVLQNIHASAAFNGTLKLDLLVLNPA